ncbi:hypothetical protein H6G81_02010 [Scytonema hofmannii FACHB-248]|uniref:Uncharacterized protein n=1 Tax=Scytonema hofmannii FACHB-248 TaxID=1842502 RepID=A0ABR8GIX3_9CYAN|nr:MULTISPECIES: O-methyltransferase [Nostocales]MBD2603332.1 hypothetical protein [Scytonema hofmannii FACHB-248]
MSGTSIPYHLRQNKAIDRYAFMELLAKIDKFCDISEYSYIGFGGHSLEDFKYVHSYLRISNMISIEEDEEVYKRQKFNQPHNCIDCFLKPSSDFINDFERTDGTIIWLDYTKPSDLRNQIEEFQAIFNKLLPFDVIKITLNANASSYLEARTGAKTDEIHQPRLEELRRRLGDIFPYAEVTTNMMTKKRFPEALCLVLKFAANLATQGRPDVYFQPITSFSYSDGGHEMLTVTGIILEKEQEIIFFDKTNIKQWELSNTNWGKPQRINVPNLTVKERLYIDALLPNSEAEAIQENLGFLFDKNDKLSLEMLKTYVMFYRQCPFFSKILI